MQVRNQDKQSYGSMGQFGQSLAWSEVYMYTCTCLSECALDETHLLWPNNPWEPMACPRYLPIYIIVQNVKKNFHTFCVILIAIY